MVLGSNASGELGDGTATFRSLVPVRTAGVDPVQAVSVGEAHSLALNADGTISGWGSNGYGQVGDGTTVNRGTPVDVSGLSSMVSMVAGTHRSLALGSDGTVWAWGDNVSGQLGDGTAIDKSTPTKVSEADFSWKTATATLSPLAGTYATAQTVTLASLTSGAAIYYTTNGTTPTTSSSLYLAPFVFR